MNAPNIADYLDDATIQDACSKIIGYAEDYERMGSDLEKCSEYFTKDVLQIEGQTMEETIQLNGEEIKKIREYIEDYVKTVSNASSTAAMRIQAEIIRQTTQTGNSGGNGSLN